MAPSKSITHTAYTVAPPWRASLYLVLVLLLCFGHIRAQREKLVTVKRVLPLIGCSFEITVVARNEEIGYINIEEAVAEIRRIEQMISSDIASSEVNRVNKNAGIKPVVVSSEFFQLVKRSLKISEITEGAFDISYAAYNKIWRFDGTMEYLPTPEEIYKVRQHVGYNKIIMNEKELSIFLPTRGMQISFAGMARGYALEKARDLLQARLVAGGIINAAGDITAWGQKVSGEQWVIGIDNPRDNKNLFTWVPLLDGSVATSNLYSRYVEFRGKKYAHILDPRSGYPVTGILKVAIFGRSAEFCDALATAITVLGPRKGLKLVNKLTGIEAIILDNTNTQHRSMGFQGISRID